MIDRTLKTAPDSPELMTTREVATYLRTTPGALYTDRARGRLPAVLGFRLGRQILWRRIDLERWVDTQANDQALNYE